MSSRRKKRLTKARIVCAAVKAADRDGLDAISMRSLAAALGAGTMSLYNHVRNKEELLDAMVEEVAAEIERARPEVDWREGVRAIAVSARAALHRHPWAVEIWSVRPPGPQRWALMETVLAQLASAGLPDDVQDLAFHAILNHVLGHTRQELASVPSGPARELEEAAARLADEGFPHVGAHIRYHAEEHPTHDAFLFVLDIILEGLEARAQ
jgi:AcrR family transcriptional regulator